MTKVPTSNAGLVLRQIETLLDVTPESVSDRSRALLEAMRLWDKFCSLAPIRCDLVRCAVPDMESAQALRQVVRDSPIPVVADIHFDYRLALAAVESGVHKIRINPGNLGGEGPVRIVAEACREAGVPIRVGVNAGSLERRWRKALAEISDSSKVLGSATWSFR
jgi:4-hydroxy-3-methylbut-2-en-1-yl diphosphate synthase IspG/GcpE